LDNRKSGNLNKQSLIQFRVDQNLKVDAEDICEQLGIELTTVLRMCLKQLIIQKGIPFSVHLNIEKEIHSSCNAQSVDLEDKFKKGFDIDINKINEEVNFVRKENRL
jgi:addiction module antitoxin, relB/dinJ family